MPFKTIRPGRPLPRLSGFSILAVTGPDSGGFLQAQTMNDVRGLAAMQWQWNGWLNPKGRLIALFALLKLDDERFLAVLPDFPAAELAAMLQRFVFRSKLKLQVASDLVCAGELPAEAADAGSTRDRATGDVENGLRLDWSGDESHRMLWLLPEALTVAADPELDAAWLVADMSHGLPRVGSEQVESWTPQMLSLDALHAFSLKKGCYPGQEIVARTHYLGKSKRRLAAISGQGLTVGAVLKNDAGVEIGVVIKASADTSCALAVVGSDHAASHALTSGKEVRIVPFLQGFQRPV